jgi:hypothetical protein
VERLNATGAKDPIDVVIGRWTSWTEQVQRNSFIGNNKLLGAEMLGRPRIGWLAALGPDLIARSDSHQS